jgi:multimeric flavodoxin WrbA
MMKALILNGSAPGQTLLDQAQDKLIDLLKNLGWEVTAFRLRDMNLQECVGCFNCWVKTPGLCSTQDDGTELNRQLFQSDLMTLITPIQFGGYGFLLKRALERTVLPNLLPSFVSFQGETHHPWRSGRKVRLMGIGSLPAQDAESERIFDDLLKRNSMNFQNPPHSSAVLYEGMTEDSVQLIVQDLVAQLGARP